jgi:hypothetical protein
MCGNALMVACRKFVRHNSESWIKAGQLHNTTALSQH